LSVPSGTAVAVIRNREKGESQMLSILIIVLVLAASPADAKPVLGYPVGACEQPPLEAGTHVLTGKAYDRCNRVVTRRVCKRFCGDPTVVSDLCAACRNGIGPCGIHFQTFKECCGRGIQICTEIVNATTGEAFMQSICPTLDACPPLPPPSPPISGSPPH